MSEQTIDLRKELIQYLLRHRGSYAYLLDRELVQITGGQYWHIYRHHTNYNLSIKRVCITIVVIAMC